MFEDYTEAILLSYEKRKVAGELSLNLTYPTPANLRNECEVQLKKSAATSDQLMLKSFLGKPQQDELTLSAIRRVDPDKFKPLRNFLYKRIKTKEQNVELLAWLIDFNPRPYLRFCKLAEKGQIVKQRQMKSHSVLMPMESFELELQSETTTQDWIKEKRVSNEPALSNVYLSDRLAVKRRLPTKGAIHSYENNLINRVFAKENDAFPYTLGSEEKVLLEYPSGVKLTVDASNIELISKLVRL